MEKLTDSIDLTGQIEEISMMDLRSRPGEIITAVSYGKKYIIKRNNKPLAVLMKLPGERLSIIVNPKGEISYE